jgi:hypothetical protein
MSTVTGWRKRTIMEMAREANLPSCHTTHPKALERFAALVRADERNRTWTPENWTEYERSIAAQEREAISDEWHSSVYSDLEHGVKCLNEQAAKDWLKNYPEISKFGAWLEARGEQA